MQSTKSEGSAKVTSHRVGVLGGELAYDEDGRGEPVLFIHSAIADRRMWEDQSAHFSRDHRVVCFDLRGFGGSSPASGEFSYTDDIHSLLTHLRISRAFLVGCSMGGAFAIDFALAYPQMVSGLLLAAPGLSGGVEAPFEPDEKSAFEYDEKKSEKITEAWSNGDRSEAVELLRQLWCSALTGPSLDLFRTMVEENSAEVFENQSMKLATNPPPAYVRLGEIRMPTTILIGDQDNPSSPVFARRIARGIPRARLVNVPGADHLVNLSTPKAFDVELTAALRKLG